jgi:hypothetical protein
MTTMEDDLQREVSKTSIHSDDIEVSRIHQNALPKDSTKKKIGDDSSEVGDKENVVDLKVIRPPIEYDSPKKFAKSVARYDLIDGVTSWLRFACGAGASRAYGHAVSFFPFW